jgi:hypothetical protein
MKMYTVVFERDGEPVARHYLHASDEAEARAARARNA